MKTITAAAGVLLSACCVVVAIAAADDRPAIDDHESAWSAYLAERIGGDPRRRCWDGSRPDILTDVHAIEVDRAPKWAEGVGQASLYASLTSRRGVLLILVSDVEAERRYLWRATVAGQAARVDVWLWDQHACRWLSK